MKLSLFVILLLCALGLRGQPLPPNFNLIPNPSLEFGSVNGLLDTTFDSNNSTCWTRANKFGAPFYHTGFFTDTIKDSRVPRPRSGDTYGQILSSFPATNFITQVFADSISMSFCKKKVGWDARTYYQSRLLEPLQAGVTYYFSVYAGYCHYSHPISQGVVANLTNLGVHISDTQIKRYDTLGFMGLVPQINFSGWSISTLDSFTYIKLKSSYTAVGGERYLTIGNFDTSNYTIAYWPVLDSPVSAGWAFACDVPSRLSIDDAALVRDTTQPIISLDHFSLGRDTVLCPGQSVTIGGEPHFFHYWWSTGDTSRFITVQQPGTYWCTVDFGCNTYTDTLVITASQPPPPFTLGKDTAVCPQERVTLTAPSGFVPVWSNGVTAGRIIVPPGFYSCTISNGCGSQTAAITIAAKETPITRSVISGARNLCEDGILVSREWTANSSFSLRWSTGDTARTTRVAVPGWYSVTEYNECGQNKDSAFATGCKGIVAFPSAFSPNGDGSNEVFRPVVQDFSKVASYTLRVYNRWGQCVFVSGKPLDGWDGRWKGQPAEPGVYYFTSRYLESGIERSAKGDVTLMR